MIVFCLAVVYFPASGYRVDRGALANVSVSSYCWSSSSCGIGEIYSVLLFSNVSGVSPCFVRYRFASRPVRCVQAFV